MAGASWRQPDFVDERTRRPTICFKYNCVNSAVRGRNTENFIAGSAATHRQPKDEYQRCCISHKLYFSAALRQGKAYHWDVFLKQQWRQAILGPSPVKRDYRNVELGKSQFTDNGTWWDLAEFTAGRFGVSGAKCEIWSFVFPELPI